MYIQISKQQKMAALTMGLTGNSHDHEKFQLDPCLRSARAGAGQGGPGLGPGRVGLGV